MPDGTYADEDNDGDPNGDVPRATADDVTSVSPAIMDWYDTVKLHYGYDFTTMIGSYDPMSKTWTDVDEIVAYWQTMGVDGFRVDFAHYIPLDFWEWEVAQARDPDAYFLAEAYEDDPNGVPGFTFPALLSTGFDAVYDDALYDTVKSIFCCGGKARSKEVQAGNFGEAPGTQMLVEAEAVTAQGRSTGCANRSAGLRDAFVGQLTVQPCYSCATGARTAPCTAKKPPPCRALFDDSCCALGHE